MGGGKTIRPRSQERDVRSAAVPGRSGAPPPRLIAAMRPCGGLLNEAMGCRQGDDDDYSYRGIQGDAGGWGMQGDAEGACLTGECLTGG